MKLFNRSRSIVVNLKLSNINYLPAPRSNSTAMKHDFEVLSIDAWNKVVSSWVREDHAQDIDPTVE